ncbi:hypothetical protein MTR67_052826 [Solanum verrucosum]|uniref:Uncharacterized protein n=1 Tax=Solanum verrucosum TaxID=315347 RepID=A0AAF0V9W4_SOLVR|nr:hypothetical protein MTR67_052826 [Solanum verrucosum]
MWVCFGTRNGSRVPFTSRV